MLKHFAPSGSPIKTLEFFYWFLCNITFVDKRPAVLQEIKKRFKLEHGYMFTTGRGAMTLLLKSLRSMADDESKNEVIIPAYTCYSVASSVINAGLRIRLCDIDPANLSYDIEQLKKMPLSNALCIISANLYGIPNQLQELEDIANDNDIFLIDDAAQSFNARYCERNVGTFGIAGLFSFDKGKNITSIEGGVIATRNSILAKIIDKEYENLPGASIKDAIVTSIKVIVYYLFLNPILYWVPASLPFLNLGKTKFEKDIDIKKYSRSVAPLALQQIKRSKSITNKRVENGLWYKNKITNDKNIEKIREFTHANSVYLRYPIRIKYKQDRDIILKNATKYGVTVSYPKSLNKLEEIEQYIVNPGRFIGAEQISEQIITLPTHSYIKNKDKKSIVNIIANT